MNDSGGMSGVESETSLTNDVDGLLMSELAVIDLPAAKFEPSTNSMVMYLMPSASAMS